MTVRFSVSTLAALLALGTAHAQQEPPASVIAAAKAEGTLMMYSSDDEQRQKTMLAGFEKKYGIKGAFIRFPTGPLMQRFNVEADANNVQADIVSVSSPIPFESKPERFAALTPEVVPTLARWPKEYIKPNFILHTLDVVALVYNTEQIKPEDVPKTWSDLADPKWKGRFLLTDPQVADNYLGWLDAVERRLGMDYLRKVGAQNYKVTQSGASGVQMVAAGAVAFNAPTFTAFSSGLIAKKAPIVVTYPKDPSVISARSFGIPSKAPHPNAARLYANYLFSEEGMKLYCSVAPTSLAGDPDGKMGCVPVREGVQMRFDVSEQRKQELARAIGVAK